MPLCFPCGQQFRTELSLEQHLQSSRHTCNRCQRFFNTARGRKEHAQTSTKCSPKSTTDSQNFNQILGNQTQGSSGSHSIIGTTINVSNLDDTKEYTGIPREDIAPVFRMACHLRFFAPNVSMVLRHIETQLEHPIISALIEAALRLLPHDSSPEGKEAAKERAKRKIEEARLAETPFVDSIQQLGFHFLTESEQRELGSKSTPDILFVQPVLIHGHLCHWLEYKNYFGFRSNPFVAAKTKKQLKRYASQLGHGAVIYKLGFEKDHILSDDIKSFREAEFLRYLERKAIR